MKTTFYISLENGQFVDLVEEIARGLILVTMQLLFHCDSDWLF